MNVLSVAGHAIDGGEGDTLFVLGQVLDLIKMTLNLLSITNHCSEEVDRFVERVSRVAFQYRVEAANLKKKKKKLEEVEKIPDNGFLHGNSILRISDIDLETLQMRPQSLDDFEYVLGCEVVSISIFDPGEALGCCENDRG